MGCVASTAALRVFTILHREKISSPSPSHTTSASSTPRISFRLDFISLLADDKTSRAGRGGGPRDRGIALRYPPGWVGRGLKPMAWCGWRGSLEELQQFRNCFPFFCSLNCFPRSTVLSEALPPTPYRSTNCRTAPALPPFRPVHDAKASSSAIRRTFHYYRFSADERQPSGRAQITGKSILLFPLLNRAVVTGRSSHASSTSIDFFFPFWIFGCCIIYTGAVITA